MESLYLLIPLSVVLVMIIGAVLVWAVMSGQFEQLDDVGERALREEADRSDSDQLIGPNGAAESRANDHPR